MQEIAACGSRERTVDEREHGCYGSVPLRVRIHEAEGLDAAATRTRCHRNECRRSCRHRPGPALLPAAETKRAGRLQVDVLDSAERRLLKGDRQIQCQDISGQRYARTRAIQDTLSIL